MKLKLAFLLPLIYLIVLTLAWQLTVRVGYGFYSGIAELISLPAHLLVSRLSNLDLKHLAAGNPSSFIFNILVLAVFNMLLYYIFGLIIDFLLKFKKVQN